MKLRSDIGGLDQVISSLKETVIYPLIYPELFSSNSLVSAPKGVLLYGPPGCGKTMLAKAVAAESGATFINLRVSALTDKWFGESNRLANAVFSLAEKLQPCIIFIDEIDSFLRERQKADYEVMAMLKAEFMTHWDGLATDSPRIVVLGATNRPNDIDPAVLRRMPKRFAIDKPNAVQRRKILQLTLKSTSLEQDFDLDALVDLTSGHSGSDITELCRNAAMKPVREYLRANSADVGQAVKRGFKVRPLSGQDFLGDHVEQPIGGQLNEIFESALD